MYTYALMNEMLKECHILIIKKMIQTRQRNKERKEERKHERKRFGGQKIGMGLSIYQYQCIKLNTKNQYKK